MNFDVKLNKSLVGHPFNPRTFDFYQKKVAIIPAETMIAIDDPSNKIDGYPYTIVYTSDNTYNVKDTDLEEALL